MPVTMASEGLLYRFEIFLLISFEFIKKCHMEFNDNKTSLKDHETIVLLHVPLLHLNELYYCADCTLSGIQV